MISQSSLLAILLWDSLDRCSKSVKRFESKFNSKIGKPLALKIVGLSFSLPLSLPLSPLPLSLSLLSPLSPSPSLSPSLSLSLPPVEHLF